jgi:hypothetical protein
VDDTKATEQDDFPLTSAAIPTSLFFIPAAPSSQRPQLLLPTQDISALPFYLVFHTFLI